MLVVEFEVLAVVFGKITSPFVVTREVCVGHVLGVEEHPCRELLESDVIARTMEFDIVRGAAHPSAGGIFLGDQAFAVRIHDPVDLLSLRLVDFCRIGSLEDALVEVGAVAIFLEHKFLGDRHGDRASSGRGHAVYDVKSHPVFFGSLQFAGVSES